MDVVLLTHNVDQIVNVALAAKLTHEPDERGIEYMLKKCRDKVHAGKIIESCLNMKHESVLEHASFTFYVEGVSRTLTHQLVRHRLASYSQQSQRYVKMKEPTYVMPPELSDIEVAKFKVSMILAWDTYKNLIDGGMKPEDARFVLPNACTTKIMITMNARELRHFFELRIHPHAQWEIREMAGRMFFLAHDKAPLLFKDLLKIPYIYAETHSRRHEPKEKDDYSWSD